MSPSKVVKPGYRVRKPCAAADSSAARDAITLLDQTIGALDEGAVDAETRRAIASHYLLTPGIRPALLPKRLFSKLVRQVEVVHSRCKNAETAPGEVSEAHQMSLEISLDGLPFPPVETHAFDFIDLFAGIGGFRIAMQENGGRCVFSCEWDANAQKTYEANFGEVPYGDIRKIPASEIPDHDVLCAGFPCQPFSLAGVSKKNSLGRKHGFEDETQGTLFFDVARIIKAKRPKAILLENVKNLLSHGKGSTFEVIRRTLEDELGYVIRWRVVDGSRWVPQSRQRVFIIGYDPGQVDVSKEEIVVPSEPPIGYRRKSLREIIEPKVPEKYTLGPGTWAALERHRAYHTKAGNGFGFGLHTVPISKEAVARTISARYYKDGAEILIEQPGSRPRRLMVKEAMQLQGYDPLRFVFPVSDVQAYRQIGNSVIVPVVAACGAEIAGVLRTRTKSNPVK